MTDRNINKIARLDIPTLRMEELVIGKKYRVTELKSSDTKYGKKVLVTLDTKCVVFLPARVSAALLNNPEEYEYHTKKVEERQLHIRVLEGDYHRFEFLYED